MFHRTDVAAIVAAILLISSGCQSSPDDEGPLAPAVITSESPGLAPAESIQIAQVRLDVRDKTGVIWNQAFRGNAETIESVLDAFSATLAPETVGTHTYEVSVDGQIADYGPVDFGDPTVRSDMASQMTIIAESFGFVPDDNEGVGFAMACDPVQWCEGPNSCSTACSCAAGYQCQSGSGSICGTCRASVSTGCSSDSDCARGTRCASGVCKKQDQSSCTSNLECSSGRCESYRCATNIGGYCSNDRHCSNYPVNQCLGGTCGRATWLDDEFKSGIENQMDVGRVTLELLVGNGSADGSNNDRSNKLSVAFSDPLTWMPPKEYILNPPDKRFYPGERYTFEISPSKMGLDKIKDIEDFVLIKKGRDGLCLREIKLFVNDANGEQNMIFYHGRPTAGTCTSGTSNGVLLDDYYPGIKRFEVRGSTLRQGRLYTDLKILAIRAFFGEALHPKTFTATEFRNLVTTRLGHRLGEVRDTVTSYSKNLVLYTVRGRDLLWAPEERSNGKYIDISARTQNSRWVTIKGLKMKLDNASDPFLYVRTAIAVKCIWNGSGYKAQFSTIPYTTEKRAYPQGSVWVPYVGPASALVALFVTQKLGDLSTDVTVDTSIPCNPSFPPRFNANHSVEFNPPGVAQPGSGGGLN